MTYRDRRRYDMLLRVRNFGEAHAQLFPSTSPAQAAFAAIAAAIAELEALDVAERAAVHAVTAAGKAAARQALTRCLTRARHTTRVLARATPALAARAVLPRVTDDLQLLTVAREFAAAALPYATQFAEHGIAVEELQERIAAFDGALHERDLRQDDLVQARARIEATLARAFEAVETLDVAVANHLGNDPVTLAVWKRDRRVVYTGRTRTETPEPAAPPAAAA